MKLSKTQDKKPHKKAATGNDHGKSNNGENSFAALKALKKEPTQKQTQKWHTHRNPISLEEQQRRENIKRALSWLYTTFPECFNQNQPKPLKTNIQTDIFNELPEDGTIPRIHIRMALKFYTSRYLYQKALIENTHRFDLKSNPVEEIEQQHKDHTLRLLEGKEKRRKDKVESKAS